MKTSIIVFGNGQAGELAKFYFDNDSPYTVKAFTVDGAYIKENTFLGLPNIPFEDISKDFPQENHAIFIALGYSNLNQLRKEKYLASKEKGYQCVSYISSKATVLCPKENIGDNCFILENNTLQPFCHIGNNVTLWSGNHIGHHSRVEDHCFVTSHVVISGNVIVEEACFLGVNATLRNEIIIGESSIVGAGSWVNKNVPKFAVLTAKAADLRNIESHAQEKI